MEEYKPEVPEPEKPYTKYEGEVLYSGTPSTPESTDPLSNDLGHEDKGSLRIDREPTAKSPEGKHSIFDVLRKKKVSIPIIGTVATAAAAAAIYVGFSRLSTDNSSKQGNQPVATASVTPGSTETPTATPTEQPASGETSAVLSPDKIRSYAPTMEKFKSMDVNTFESLSRDDRLMYSKYLDDNTVVNLVYKFRYSEYTKHHEFMIDPVVVSSDNTGQEIINDNLYSLQLAYLQYTHSGGGADSSTNSTPDYFNLSDGRKALSSVYYDVGDMNGTNIVTRVYQNNVALQETLAQPTVLIGKWTAKHTSNLLSGTNNQGETVQYKDVAFQDSEGITNYDRFVYVEFHSYDGSQQAVWLLDAQASSTDELKSLGTVK